MPGDLFPSGRLCKEINAPKKLLRDASSQAAEYLLKNVGYYQKAMLMGSYFSPMHINYLLAERYLPNHIVLHIDLRSLFFWKKLALMIGFTPLEEINLESAKKASNLLDTFWCHPFFQKFQTISISTFAPNYNENLKRFTSRAQDPDSFFLGKDKPSEIYNELYNSWFESLDKLEDSFDLVNDNIIHNDASKYHISPRKLPKSHC